MVADRTTSGGRLLLLLTSRDLQRVAQLASAGNLSLADTLRQLDRLVDQGFIVAARDGDGPAVYRLRPRPLSVADRTTCVGSCCSTTTRNCGSWS